jgi:hypothetical protein
MSQRVHRWQAAVVLLVDRVEIVVRTRVVLHAFVLPIRPYRDCDWNGPFAPRRHDCTAPSCAALPPLAPDMVIDVTTVLGQARAE